MMLLSLAFIFEDNKMITILFVLSLTSLILFIPSLFGVRLPVPILHIWDLKFGNAYIYTPAILFQVWFWSTHFNIV